MSENSDAESPAMITRTGDDAVIVVMTAEMVPEAGRIHVDALPGSKTAIIGAAYSRAFIDWFRQEEHGCIALAAIDSRGDVVGYVFGAPFGCLEVLSRDLTWLRARAYIVRPWLIFAARIHNDFLDRLRRLLVGASTPQAARPDIPAPSMWLVEMGVLPAARRKKIGLRLVQAFEKKAQELQIRSLLLSTRCDNVAACRLYERCGWRSFPLSDDRTYYFRIFPSSTDE